MGERRVRISQTEWERPPAVSLPERGGPIRARPNSLADRGSAVRRNRCTPKESAYSYSPRSRPSSSANSGQADECKPSSLNIPGAPYPCVHADRRVTFRVSAPEAQKVQVRLGGAHDMTKGSDGLWMVTIPPQVVGSHYYSIVIDGATVADPATGTFFCSGWANSGVA